jgi:hypothetical protein
MRAPVQSRAATSAHLLVGVLLREEAHVGPEEHLAARRGVRAELLLPEPR